MPKGLRCFRCDDMTTTWAVIGQNVVTERDGRLGTSAMSPDEIERGTWLIEISYQEAATRIKHEGLLHLLQVMQDAC